jgi:hypothetical protein
MSNGKLTSKAYVVAYGGAVTAPVLVSYSYYKQACE